MVVITAAANSLRSTLQPPLDSVPLLHDSVVPLVNEIVWFTAIRLHRELIVHKCCARSRRKKAVMHIGHVQISNHLSHHVGEVS
jgi:hypothetical protein